MASISLDYLDSQMADYVFSAGGAVKTADVAREMGERLGASARLVRNELAGSVRLMLVDRRWDLRSRHEGRSRSIDGALQFILKQRGKPVGLTQLARELALHRNQAPHFLVRVVSALVRSRPLFFITSEESVGLSEWLLQVEEGDSDADVRRLNFRLSDADLDGAIDQLDIQSAVDAPTHRDAFVALVSSVEEPVACRLLLYALWRARGLEGISLEVVEEALQDPRIQILPGPAFATLGYHEQLNRNIVELSAQHETEASGAEPLTIEEILGGDLVADDEFELHPDDLQEIQRIINDAGQALALPNIVSDVLELFPGDLQYTAAVRAVAESLQADDRFVELEDHRWHLRVLLPPTLYRIPVTLQLSPIHGVGLTGDPTDVVLEDAGLDGGLEWEVHAPDLEDIDEEEEVPELAAGMVLATRQRFVTSYRHFVSGTIKVRKIDRGVFPAEPEIQPVAMTDQATGEQFQLWLNNTTGLLCGLDEWYKGRLQPAGHVFYLERRPDQEMWVAEVDAEPDAAQFIPQERLDDLLVTRVKLEHVAEVSALDIMCELMATHPQGVSFRRLYTECNIVRRMAKRVIASNLSAYPMFSLNEDETLWLYDERRRSRLMDAAKQAHLRAPQAD